MGGPDQIAMYKTIKITHKHINTHIYIYIYIFTEREREMYTYIHKPIHTYIYIYIYISGSRAAACGPRRGGVSGSEVMIIRDFPLTRNFPP